MQRDRLAAYRVCRIVCFAQCSADALLVVGQSRGRIGEPVSIWAGESFHRLKIAWPESAAISRCGGGIRAAPPESRHLELRGRRRHGSLERVHREVEDCSHEVEGGGWHVILPLRMKWLRSLPFLVNMIPECLLASI